MYTELTIKEEAAQAHEQGVRRAAMERAKNHVLDILLVVEQQLQRIRWNCDPGHDSSHRMDVASFKQGESLVNVILEVLPEITEIDYAKTVAACYDEDEQTLENEEGVIDEVKKHAEQLLKGLKVKP